MPRSLLLASLAVMSFAAAARAQVPAGTEFQANTYTTGNQFIYGMTPVAVDALGNFVVVWESRFQEPDGNYGVYGQRYDRRGARVGGEFHVNEFATAYQGIPAAAALGGGRFVVTWESGLTDGSSYGVLARLFDMAGPLTHEFIVPATTLGAQLRPAVAAAADGRFVVVWQSENQDGNAFGVFGQRFTSGGVRVGAEFRANTYTPGNQQRPSLAATADGAFLVVWASTGQDGSGDGVFGQLFDAAGARRGAEFRVNTYTTGVQGAPAAGANGPDFVVAWNSVGQDGNNYGIVGQRVAATGGLLGAEFLVNTYTTGPTTLPHPAADRAGNFTVSWTQYPAEDGNSEGIFAQRFDAAGARRGGEFQVNTYTFTNQDYGTVAVDAVGNFVVVWSSRNLDGVASEAAAGQRFGGLLPAGLAVDAAGNGVLDPGLPEEVKPSWRNVNGAAQTFGSTAVRLTGPAGATYTITDGTASYGTVPDDTVAACGDCLGVNVTAATRPLQHWDATLDERITPDAHGQQRAWLLHVGGSFGDVSSASPFYRFVETLLHKGITGGCGGSNYCPTTATTRDQMAVFVLVAKEGGAYTPPACTTPVFNDVPAASAFCRWIEELARRGVVSGCGNGSYCPGDPVTREQMAIFVLRTLDPALSPPACVPPNLFADVPETSVFCRWIEELANRGIVSGCGGGNYCPTEPVTREQMGVFLSATFGLTLYGL